MQKSALSIVSGPLFSSLSTGNHANRRASLGYIFERIRLNLVPLNAQDVYAICTTAYHSDTIGMMQDGDFMRGISDAFQRSDQTVLTPFQTSLISDALRRAGISTSPKEVLVPEDDAISPEALLDVLRAMTVRGGTRDERKISDVLRRIPVIIDEFSPTQLSLAITELGKLRCTNADAMGKLAKRLFERKDEIGPFELSSTVKALALTRGIPFTILRRSFSLAEERLAEFQPEDYVYVLTALQSAGQQYSRTFAKVVEKGLEHVENMDAMTLTQYLVTFTTMEYRNREHIEIYGDALVEVATDLDQRELVQAFVALQRLHLLSEDMFATMTSCLMRYARVLEPRCIAAVMDVCSSVPHNSDNLMRLLLDRAMECTRLLSPYNLAEILDITAQYPPARSHPFVEVFGRQARLRLDIVGPRDLAMTTRGLSRLGFRDTDFYIQAAETGFRFGFKDWSFLEPILMGLCLSEECPLAIVKSLASYAAPMARSMSMPDIERANRYFLQLQCEEEYVFRALASRALHFVKEITPDMPEELQMLIQRGAMNRMTET